MAKTLWHFCDACDHYVDDDHHGRADAVDQQLALGASSDLLHISWDYLDHAA